MSTETIERPRSAGPGSGLGGSWRVIVLNVDHNTFDHVAKTLARVFPGVNLDAGYRWQMIPVPMQAQTARGTNPLVADVERLSAELNPQVVAWRRDFHQHPELGNRETRTAKVIADELRELGFTVTTGVATTGVVGVLKGGLPGPVVALRSDMDALPVTEQGDLPFKSITKTQWNGQEVGVMHACGHDNHMAILLGAATALAARCGGPAFQGEPATGGRVGVGGGEGHREVLLVE